MFDPAYLASNEVCVNKQGRAIDIKGSALNTEIEKAMNLIGESLKVLPSSVSYLYLSIKQFLTRRQLCTCV